MLIEILIVVTTILLILTFLAVKLGLTGKLTVSVGSFDLIILLLAIIYIISSFFVSPSVMDSIILPGTTTFLVSSAIIYFLINQLGLRRKKMVTYLFYFTAVIYSIIILLSITKVITYFAVESSLMQSALLLISLIPFSISFISTQKSTVNKLLIVASLSIILFAISASVFSVLPTGNSKVIYPSFNVSTKILLRTLKQYPLFGIGSGNYLESFNKFRPIEFNSFEGWANKYNYGASHLLTVGTEIGFAGIFTYLALFISFFVFANKEIKNRKKVGWGYMGSVDLLSPFILIIFFFVFPATPIIVIAFFIVLGLVGNSKKYEYLMPSKLTAVIISVPLLVLISITGYKTYTLANAEYNFQLALEDVKENKAKSAYERLSNAIKLNSGVDRYHRVMSSINFAIASSLNDTKQSPIFVQESINEAKAAVAINSKKSDNWEQLGKTYKLLIPFAEGAGEFAVEAYKEAIILDPINPTLRIALGENYMLKKDYVSAIETFKLAVLAKNDHPNSHYNLANAYKENGQRENALKEIDLTIKLLDPNSKDYQKAMELLRQVNQEQVVVTDY